MEYIASTFQKIVRDKIIHRNRLKKMQVALKNTKLDLLLLGINKTSLLQQFQEVDISLLEH